jgi:hypothetical protein
LCGHARCGGRVRVGVMMGRACGSGVCAWACDDRAARGRVRVMMVRGRVVVGHV